MRRLLKWFIKSTPDQVTYLLLKPYTVKYPVSYGCSIINEEEYHCLAWCKYHAFLQFIMGTKDEHNHYSARENRTPLAFETWVDDISED